jgi:hypothetical protein
MDVVIDTPVGQHGYSFDQVVSSFPSLEGNATIIVTEFVPDGTIRDHIYKVDEGSLKVETSADKTVVRCTAFHKNAGVFAIVSFMFAEDGTTFRQVLEQYDGPIVALTPHPLLEIGMGSEVEFPTLEKSVFVMTVGEK